jgi:hypothetical protein
VERGVRPLYFAMSWAALSGAVFTSVMPWHAARDASAL